MRNKKNYIQTLAGITLALFIFMNLSSCNQQVADKKVGIQLWSVKDDMKKDVKGTIERIGQMGYAYIEAAGYSDGQFYGVEPADFKALIEANGMVFLSSHTGQGAPDSIKWDSTMMWWDKCIEAHVAAGVKYIVQPWMGSPGYDSIAGLQNYCKYFNAVGEKCNAKGIRFGYHNHDKEFGQIGETTIYNYMLENTDPEKVMFQLDLYWIDKGGKVAVDYFNQYPGRFELWHVKDKEEVGASGEIDYKTTYENAEKSGMKYYIVEVEHYNFEPLVSVEKSLEFLKSAEYVK